MIQIDGIWWPDDVGTDWIHALQHVKSLEWALERCRLRARLRTAVQAGGNVGLWPQRMAQSFRRVITFEPDHSLVTECLLMNVSADVEIRHAALGDVEGTCAIKHRGLGSARVVDGDSVEMTTIDALELEDVDLIQLDVEGYEWHALRGARKTILRCKPLIQVELRPKLLLKYGHDPADIREYLTAMSYKQVSIQPGSDFVFEAQ